MGTSYSKPAPISRNPRCKVELDFTPKTHAWLVAMAGRTADVDGKGCETDRLTIDLDLMIEVLSRIDPNYRDYFELVLTLQKYAGLSKIDTLLDTISNAEPSQIAAFVQAIMSNKGSGWIEDATGKYGEDDGKRGTQGFTNLSDL